MRGFKKYGFLLVALAGCAPSEPEIARERADETRRGRAIQPPTADSAIAPPAAGRTASTAALPPLLAMPVGSVMLGPTGKLPVTVENVDAAELAVLGLRVTELAAVRPLLGVHRSGDDPLAQLPQSLIERVRREHVPAAESQIDVFSSVKEPLALAVLKAPGAPSRVALLQRGELSVLLKTGEESGLVWVTSTQTGAPVAGTTVTVRQGDSERFRGRTDEQGLLRLPAERRLRIPFIEGAEHEHASLPLEVVAQKGTHTGVTSETFRTGIEPWQFDLPETYYRGADALRGSVNTERGIYRPGESVHILGVLRQRLSNGKLAPPQGSVALSVTDADGNEIHDGEPLLTEFGTFRAELPIAKSARLGRYSVVVRKLGLELRGRFEVGEYRPVRFEVSASAVADGDSGQITFPVSAAYLYGSPLANGKLKLSISAREKTEFGAGASGFDFGACASFSHCFRGSGLSSIADEEVDLDAQGRATVSLPAERIAAASGGAQALDLIVEASVQDAGGDVVTARSSHVWLRGRAAVGLSTDDWVVNPSKGWTVKLLVADARGAPRAGEKVELRLSRRKWVAAASDHGGASRYQGRWEEEVVRVRQTTSTKRAEPVHFALPAGGEYRLEARLSGQERGATARVWAYGGDAYGAWDNHARMELRSDRDSYASGDRARLYAEVPYEKAYGLVTLEREGVLEARVLRLDGAGTPIEVELSERRVPNVFASVAVVPAGLGRGSPAAGPPLRVGYKELRIDPEKRRLRVDVRTSSSQARPGQKLDIDVRVTDARGLPARAEVTLWGADEGVLKLTGYTTPDPFQAAYERHSHQVRTAANLLRWVAAVSDEDVEYGGDGSPGADGSAALRSRFLSTAFFSKGIVTNARGEGRISIPLPDNLTRWRVMAAAADAGERFGSGETSVTTAKPLQVEPALPRFLTLGDVFAATVLVHNRTARAGTATVELQVEGAELLSPATATLALPAGAQAPLRYSVRATQRGKARFRAKAKLAQEFDGFQVELPVHAPTLWQTALVGEGRLDAPAKLRLAVPESAADGLSELIVGVAPGVLASIGGSVDALVEYPHGCVEQTTSRLIPMVLLEDILRPSGDARFASKQHRVKLENAVAHVLKHQNADGGFGLWPSSPSEGFLTAYALWGLLTARDHGYVVPASAMKHGLAYLAQNTGKSEDMHGQFDPGETRPFAAYVLASAKEADAGLGRELASDAGNLSRFGFGLLGAALAQRAGEPLRGFDGWRAALTKTRTGALVAERSAKPNHFSYGTDLRATAATVHALLLAGKAAQAEPLIAGILDERRSDGSWGTTYNNLWALRALADYAEHERGTASTGSVHLELDGARVATLASSKSAPYQTITLPTARLPRPGSVSALRISAAEGSSLRYTARLRWASRVDAASPVDKGLRVRRTLLDAETGAEVKEPRLGQLLKVRLEVSTDEERAQVALVDRLPAGFEAVDTALQTTPQDHAGPASWVWVHRELHDERVSHFADRLPAGTHEAEYLVRATRSGTFVRPAPSAELMYAPDVFGHGSVETVKVR